MARISLNPKGIEDLLTDAGVRADLRKRAERVLGAVQESAPNVTGEFVSSLSIEEDTTDRAVVRVVSSDPGALVIEARTGVMTRALDAAGG